MVKPRIEKFVFFLFILLSLVSPFSASADMGRILTQDVRVLEDSQKAIIFHNLSEEVLILGTDLVGNQETTILRFIPFPSEAQVDLARSDPFNKAFSLIKKHNLQFLIQTKAMGGGSSGIPIEMHFHAKLGAHDVTVIRINQISELEKWVHSFLRSRGLSPQMDYQEVKKVALEYVNRGIDYFVFDLVYIRPELHSVKPLVYRFNSKRLYYPLKTSNTFGGNGAIDLVIIAPGTLCDPISKKALYIDDKDLYTAYPCFEPFGDVKDLLLVSTSAEITMEEAKSIYPLADGFFDETNKIFIQLIRYVGQYNFDDDIWIDISSAKRSAIRPPEFNLNSPLSKLLKGLSIYSTTGEKLADSKPAKGRIDKVLSIKRACLKATLNAIEMEIKRVEQKLKAAKDGPGNPANIAFLKKRIEQLHAQELKLKNTNPASCKIPERRQIKVNPTHAYEKGALLEVKGMSRSGPFYHLAGIKGDDYRVLKPGNTYRLSIYLVYPREYPFPSYYVYIENVK